MAPSVEVQQLEYEFDKSFVDSLIQPSGSDFVRPKKTDGLESKKREADYLIGKALYSKISQIDPENCEPGEEDSFFVVDLGEVKRAVDYWRMKLPHVHPHYAVKCNNDPEVIRFLASENVNFDCASQSEIEFVLSFGVSPDRIVFANPCKTNSYIRYANNKNVNLTTADNVDELYKIKKYHPDCGILIRIVTDDSSAQCRLSTKFGCTMEAALTELLPVAKKLQLNVKGVAFHVGSGAKDYDSIYTAIRDSRVLFDKAINEFGFTGLDTLDIGGGFEQETFNETSAMVNYSLNQFFPSEYLMSQNIRIIAEPGRFVVANAFTLATHVIAKRDLSKLAEQNDSNGIVAMIYINDGVYGNLNCILFDHQHPKPFVLCHDNKFYYQQHGGQGSQTQPLDIDTDEKGKYQYSIWGPTCDGLDCVSEQAEFPTKIQVGDWLYFPNIGAYTSAASTSFNGFSNKNETIYIKSA